MPDKKKKHGLEGVEEIDVDVVSRKEDRENKRKMEQGRYDALKRFTNTQKKYLVIGMFALAVIIAIFLSILAFVGIEAAPSAWLPMVPFIFLIIVIQVGMGTLLDQNPIWLHACVFVADIVVGILIRNVLHGSIPFMVYMGIIYVTWVVSMEALQRLGKSVTKRQKKNAKYKL